MSSSSTNLIVLLFLALAVVWLFARQRGASERIFLALAGVIYISALMATLWKFGTTKIAYALLETTGFILVMLSRRIRKYK